MFAFLLAIVASLRRSFPTSKTERYIKKIPTIFFNLSIEKN